MYGNCPDIPLFSIPIADLQSTEDLAAFPVQRLTGKCTSGYISENIFAFGTKTFQITPEIVSTPYYFSRFEAIGNVDVQSDVVKLSSVGK